MAAIKGGGAVGGYEGRTLVAAHPFAMRDDDKFIAVSQPPSGIEDYLLQAGRILDLVVFPHIFRIYLFAHLFLVFSFWGGGAILWYLGSKELC